MKTEMLERYGDRQRQRETEGDRERQREIETERERRHTHTPAHTTHKSLKAPAISVPVQFATENATPIYCSQSDLSLANVFHNVSIFEITNMPDAIFAKYANITQ